MAVAASALGNEGGAGDSGGGEGRGSGRAVPPRPSPRAAVCGGGGPAAPRGRTHSEAPNLLGESQPEGGALGAAVRYPVHARVCAFLHLSWDTGVSWEAPTHSSLYRREN